MSKKVIYRCENEYGDPPCEWAKEYRDIKENEVLKGADGTVKCPECDSDLIFYRYESSGIPKGILLAGVVIMLILIAGGGSWALRKFISPSPNPQIDVETGTLVFPKSQNGESDASIRINNPGDGDLEIVNIMVQPAAFSVAETEMKIEKGSGATLIVTFNSPSNEMMEGNLQLHNNATDEPIIIRLIANQDPWWVYKKLETSSKILFTEK